MLGSDGRIYGGSVIREASSGAIDLNWNGRLGSGGHRRRRTCTCETSPSTPDGRIVCSFGTEKPADVRIDLGGGSSQPAPKSIENVQTGVAWGDYICGETTQGIQWKRTSTPVDMFSVPSLPKNKGAWGGGTVCFDVRGDAFVRQGPSILIPYT